MTKLTELIKFRNLLLDSIDNLKFNFELTEKINILESIDTIPDYSPRLDSYQLHLKKLTDELTVFSNGLLEFIDTVNEDINTLAQAMYNNEEYYDKFSEKPHSLISQESPRETHIVNKIIQHCDYKYPALQINPPSKRWIDYMVVADPLYLTYNLSEHNFFDLEKLICQYPQQYQQRLRLYEIKNRNFSILPQEQFKFVLCWDTFTCLSLDKVEQYLKEVFALLKPGGTFVFNYSNCDINLTAEQAEKLIVSYSNARLIRKICESIGYQVINLFDIPPADSSEEYFYLSYAEVQKPGNLQTVKAYQAFAQIIEK